MTLKITVPSELSISDGTNTCTKVKGLTDSSFSCVYTASTREIVITGEFTGSSNPGEVSLQIPSITNPSTYQTTSTFMINTYQTVSSVNYAIDSKSSGLTVSMKCSVQCLTCSLTASYCVTCDTSSSYKYYFSNDCLTSCYDGYYANSFVCLKCDSSCKKCSGTATNCINDTSKIIVPFPFLVLCIILSIVFLVVKKIAIKQMRYIEFKP